jgi:hypothetical protein
MKYEDLPKYNTPEWLSLDSFEGEVWKDVEGYEGIYQISNYGRVKSLERNIKRSDGGSFYFAQRILKYKKSRGYDSIGLFKGRKEGKYFRVARLVGAAFIPNPENKPQINHKDENRHNNMASNLEWCTCKYNSNYGNHNKNLSESKKRRYKEDSEFAEKMRRVLAENHKKESWKIAQRKAQMVSSNCNPVIQLSLDGKFIKRYHSQSEAYRQTGIPVQNIGQACLKRIRHAGGYKWEYQTA